MTLNLVSAQQSIFLSVCVTGSRPPVRALEMETTSVLPVSLGTLASTVNGKMTNTQ